MYSHEDNNKESDENANFPDGTYDMCIKLDTDSLSDCTKGSVVTFRGRWSDVDAKRVGEALVFNAPRDVGDSRAPFEVCSQRTEKAYDDEGGRWEAVVA